MSDDHGLTGVSCSAVPPHELRATLCVAGDHAVLPGHFPGAPVVPGVVLLDAVRQVWERASQRRCALAAVDDARFQAPLAPGAVATLRANVRTDGDSVHVDGEWHGELGRVATFRLRLVARD